MKFDRRSLLKSAVASIACLIPSVSPSSPQFERHYYRHYMEWENVTCDQMCRFADLIRQFPDNCVYGMGFQEGAKSFFWIQAAAIHDPLWSKLLEIKSNQTWMAGLSMTPVNIFQPMSEKYYKTPYIACKKEGIKSILFSKNNGCF